MTEMLVAVRTVPMNTEPSADWQTGSVAAARDGATRIIDHNDTLARRAHPFDTRPIEDVVASITTGGPIPAPASHFRLILVHQGILRLMIEGYDRIVLPRSILLVPPGSDCRLRTASGTKVTQVSFCRGVADPGILGDEVDRVLGLLRPDGLPTVVRLPPDSFEEVAAPLARLKAEARERKPGFLALQRLCLEEALVLLSRNAAPKLPERRPTAGDVEEAVRFVREHFSDELSLASLASRFALNPSYLSRAFGQHAGVPFVEFLNRIRVEKSCVLLKRSRMTILEIALWVGYHNVSWFNRSFRRVTGVSPREYRKRARM